MDKETIKDSLKKILPTVLLKTLIKYKHMRECKERHYLEQSPQFITWLIGQEKINSSGKLSTIYL